MEKVLIIYNAGVHLCKWADAAMHYKQTHYRIVVPRIISIKAVARGGLLGSEEPPPPPTPHRQRKVHQKVHYREYTKKVHYYSLLDQQCCIIITI